MVADMRFKGGALAARLTARARRMPSNQLPPRRRSREFAADHLRLWAGRTEGRWYHAGEARPAAVAPCDRGQADLR